MNNLHNDERTVTTVLPCLAGVKVHGNGSDFPVHAWAMVVGNQSVTVEPLLVYGDSLALASDVIRDEYTIINPKR